MLGSTSGISTLSSFSFFTVLLSADFSVVFEAVLSFFGSGVTVVSALFFSLASLESLANRLAIVLLTVLSFPCNLD
jgi:hypothetical protein